MSEQASNVTPLLITEKKKSPIKLCDLTAIEDLMKNVETQEKARAKQMKSVSGACSTEDADLQREMLSVTDTFKEVQVDTIMGMRFALNKAANGNSEVRVTFDGKDGEQSFRILWELVNCAHELLVTRSMFRQLLHELSPKVKQIAKQQGKTVDGEVDFIKAGRYLASLVPDA